MKSTAARKLAEEFINVLKYNPELSHDDKILSLELRLERLISDVERGCEEARQRQANEGMIVSEHPNLTELIIARDVRAKGPAN